MTLARRLTSGAAPVALVAVAVLCATFLRDAGLPGLYMDAINPDYLLPGIVDPPAPLRFIQPGNLLDNRWPVLTATPYHGSTQLYAALPFMTVFGSGLSAFRAFQLLVGVVILLAALRMARDPEAGRARTAGVAAAGLLAIDPGFVLALRTQAYSCMFPLALLFGALALLESGVRRRLGRWALVLSGACFGLACFSYFVFAFFAPVLLWLVMRDEPRRVVPWAAGTLLGYMPFFLGITLLRREVGSNSAVWDFIESSSREPKDYSTLTAAADVLQGDWVARTIFGFEHGGPISVAKALVLVGVPVIALLARGVVTPARRRALVIPAALAASFFICGVLVGDRIQGHHYAAMLPLVYVAFGLGCAALLPVGRGVPVGMAMAVVLTAGVIGQQQFHDDVQRTGGRGYYSDSINAFARDVDRNTPGATVHAPGFGYSMPLAFLSDARYVTALVDPGEIWLGACSGRPQIVVFDGVDNRSQLRLVSRLARQPISESRIWRTRDGHAVFQTARFEGGACVPRSGGERPGFSISPSELPDCQWIARRVAARLAWNYRGRTEATTLGFAPPGRADVPFASGGASGTIDSPPSAIPGSRFTVRDAASGRLLGERELADTPCPTAPPSRPLS